MNNMQDMMQNITIKYMELNNMKLLHLFYYIQNIDIQHIII
jgi:hypothetical protein